eukprot:2041394-Prymnesium_polylepis.1
MSGDAARSRTLRTLDATVRRSRALMRASRACSGHVPSHDMHVFNMHYFTCHMSHVHAHVHVHAHAHVRGICDEKARLDELEELEG